MPSINSANNRFLNQPITSTATSYTVLLSDIVIEVTSTSAVRTITLPAPVSTGNVGKAYIIKDGSGAASVNNIIITPASGLIDGQSSISINSNYGSSQVYCDGTNYYSFGLSSNTSFAVNKRAFTSSGTYTPTVGMLFCNVEVLGGGGAGGGAPATSSGSSISGGAGGGAGEYAVGIFSASQVGGAQVVTIGAGGTANTGAAGGSGGASSFGSLISANGGSGGASSSAAASYTLGGALGGTGGTGGVYRTPGNPGEGCQGAAGAAIQVAGNGGGSQYGGAGLAPNPPGAGGAGLGHGAGGGGATIFASTAATAGGAGSSGLVLITEYITQSSPNQPVVGLAKASWSRQSSLTSFTPGATVIQTGLASDAGTTPSNTGSRVDLSSLTQLEGSNLTISQFQVTLTQAGTYQLSASACFIQSATGVNGNLQCVKNGTTVLALGIAQTSSSTSLETGSFLISADLAIGDTIDFRISTNQASTFSLISISLMIAQLPSSTILPITAWNAVSGTSQAMLPSNGYYTQNSSLTTLTLPLVAAAGTLIQISGVGSGGWKAGQNAGQFINFENQVTTTGTGGSIASTNPYDAVDLLCVSANTQWVVRTAAGNLIVT